MRRMVPSEPHELSPREIEVLAGVAEQLTNAQISRRLQVSVRTVESHVSSLLRKYGVANRTALAAINRHQPSSSVKPGHIAQIPVSHASFVGRRQERQETLAALARTAPVCLVGPGGVGKTRLGAAPSPPSPAAGTSLTPAPPAPSWPSSRACPGPPNESPPPCRTRSRARGPPRAWPVPAASCTTTLTRWRRRPSCGRRSTPASSAPARCACWPAGSRLAPRRVRAVDRRHGFHGRHVGREKGVTYLEASW